MCVQIPELPHASSRGFCWLAPLLIEKVIICAFLPSGRLAWPARTAAVSSSWFCPSVRNTMMFRHVSSVVASRNRSKAVCSAGAKLVPPEATTLFTAVSKVRTRSRVAARSPPPSDRAVESKSTTSNWSRTVNVPSRWRIAFCTSCMRVPPGPSVVDIEPELSMTKTTLFGPESALAYHGRRRTSKVSHTPLLRCCAMPGKTRAMPFRSAVYWKPLSVPLVNSLRKAVSMPLVAHTKRCEAGSAKSVSGGTMTVDSLVERRKPWAQPHSAEELPNAARH
mmetsp:Transcript_37279/g.115118  ORF Transcript_37279/g.115118 Transcript_37279/m.115118 type:complete len:279 (+) Transcript_37279:281-1117(+)